MYIYSISTWSLKYLSEPDMMWVRVGLFVRSGQFRTENLMMWVELGSKRKFFGCIRVSGPIKALAVRVLEFTTL